MASPSGRKTSLTSRSTALAASIRNSSLLSLLSREVFHRKVQLRSAPSVVAVFFQRNGYQPNMAVTYSLWSELMKAES